MGGADGALVVAIDRGGTVTARGAVVLPPTAGVGPRVLQAVDASASCAGRDRDALRLTELRIVFQEARTGAPVVGTIQPLNGAIDTSGRYPAVLRVDGTILVGELRVVLPGEP